MNRREVLQHVAALLGGAISAPALMGVLSGCSPKQAAVGTSAWKPVFFTLEQAALVSDVTDVMIPRTDTAGAVDVGVPQFIDTMLKEVYAAKDQQRFIDGLKEFAARVQSGFGKSYLQLAPADRAKVVRQAHEDALEQARQDKEPKRESRRPFILMTKELALLGFFTSIEGATKVLQYVAVPGALHACIPLSDAGNGKSWALASPARF